MGSGVYQGRVDGGFFDIRTFICLAVHAKESSPSLMTKLSYL
ncbi:hypothetical protein VCR19J5_230362 [Vibrio crassostreae]|nr:hypothetical protein VCR19J5_230362 [Vibrio crassostreae]